MSAVLQRLRAQENERAEQRAMEVDESRLIRSWRQIWRSLSSERGPWGERACRSFFFRFIFSFPPNLYFTLV